MERPVLQFNKKLYTRTGVYGKWLLYWAAIEEGKLRVCLWNEDLDLVDCYNLGGVRPGQGNMDYEITKRLKTKEFYFDSIYT